MPRRLFAGALPRAVLPLAVCCLALFAEPAQAQFRNNGVQLPSVGWMALGIPSTDWLYPPGARWNATDQVTVGVGYFRAVGYNLWLDNQVVLGFGGALSELATPPPVVSLAISVGMRYNFLDERHRPFVSGHIQYLQFFNVGGTQVAGNELLGGFPLWVGIRPSAGYEWFFAPEMSLQVEAGPVVYLGFDVAIPKLSGLARVSYNVYF